MSALPAAVRPVHIAVVLASYNRKQTTLRCLASLDGAASPDATIEVFLFDDASPDGTAAAVREAFPRTHIIPGDGNQFWCGGMRAAMKAANRTDYDFLLWLNDDVELAPDFLKILLSSHVRAEAQLGPGPHVIVGAVVDPETGALTYSGFRRRSALHPAKLTPVMPDGSGLQACDTMNGNCVLFPAAIVRQVGAIDPVYTQQIGDLDYGYRCTRNGAKLWVAPKPVGTCRVNRRRLRWSNRALSLRERLNILNTPHGLAPKPWLHFMWRFGGAVGVVLLFVGYAQWLSLSVFARERESK
jgi:GT2 family glycosyltransferase